MELKAREYEEFRSLVYAKSGITLGDGKQALVGSRIGKRMRALGLEDFGAYLDWMREPEGRDEVVHMLDAISTNVTSFFRESEHFDFIAERMKAWLSQGQRRFRFWSAACSSGEEPYSLAMALNECGLPQGCDARILATDLSTRILDAAREGVYSAAKLESLPAGYAQRYFSRVAGEGADGYRVHERLRAIVVCKRLNLAAPPFPMQGPMDVILVRNVMIYFDNAVRKQLLSECRRLLKPGGVLLVGHAESLTGLIDDFQCLKPSVYVKRKP